MAALREAGPDTEVWSWTTARNTGFWARRMVHETVIHRADAALAAGVPFDVPAPVAADCLEEWLQIGELPMVVARFAERGGELLGPGRTIHVHATDAPPGLDAEWLLDLTGAAPAHRRTHEKAAVALRGPHRCAPGPLPPAARRQRPRRGAGRARPARPVARVGDLRVNDPAAVRS